MSSSWKIVILGLPVTCSYGNGHATTWRGLSSALARRGHEVLFLEPRRAVPTGHGEDWGARGVRIARYDGLMELGDAYADHIRSADLVIVGSWLPGGQEIIDWVQKEAEGLISYYDLDTPVTLRMLREGTCPYIRRDQIRRFTLCLSFCAGTTLRRLEKNFDAKNVAALPCAFDPDVHHPNPNEEVYWDLGYMGSYCAGRQPTIDALVGGSAHRWKEGRFLVIGPDYPDYLRWPENVVRRSHLRPSEHCSFYSGQRFTLNVTRPEMIESGHAPSARIFEAAACGSTIISDYWRGMEEFLRIGWEILIADSTREVLHYLRKMPEEKRLVIGERARRRVMAEHTYDHRARKLEAIVSGIQDQRARLASLAG